MTSCFYSLSLQQGHARSAAAVLQWRHGTTWDHRTNSKIRVPANFGYQMAPGPLGKPLLPRDKGRAAMMCGLRPCACLAQVLTHVVGGP